ncbi:hypothetical protein ACVWXO_003566 [Bradyrhizobium sp. LM2.7]
MHDVGRNEGGVAGAEDAVLAIDPLLDLSGDNEHDLFLIRVLVEIMSLARIEIDLGYRELLGPGVGRIAGPAGRTKVIDLEVDLVCDNSFLRRSSDFFETLPLFHAATRADLSRRFDGSLVAG